LTPARRALPILSSREWIYRAAIAFFSVWLYWSALRAWFVADDWVWLGLRNDVHALPDLWTAIFRPTIHGTIRPWSDRVFFLVFRSLFDLDGLPYHAWIVGTQIAAALLLMAVIRRLTGSKLAGFLAPVLWTGNAVLVMAMAWVCLYKDILCSFTILLAFYFLLRYIETGRTRYNVFQWVTFVLGFGVMESNVVYPAIAVTYTLFCARKYLRTAFALVIPSIAYLAVNVLFVKKQAAGPYTMHFDRNVPVTFLRYCITALQPGTRLDHPWTRLIIPIVLGASLAAYVVVRWRRNDRLPAFFFTWFLFGIAPVLPLSGQFQTYYATLASVGLAMLGAHALASAWGSGRWIWRAPAIVLALSFLIPSVLVARREARGWRQRGLRAEALVLGVAAAGEAYPGKTIVVDRVDPLLFWDTFRDGAFHAVDVSDVYLTPGSAARISPRPFNPPPADYELPIAAMRNPERIEVYDAGNVPLRNITRAYFNHLPEIFGPPRRIDLKSKLIDEFLGGTWYPPEPGHRWMGKQASVRLAGPERPGQSLRVVAWCPANLSASGPVSLQVTVDGTALPPAELHTGEVDLSFPLSPELTGKSEIAATLQVSRTIRPPGEDRDLGLPVLAVEIR
jgi:hypothetical protein